jgi:hypothetical protein
MEAWAAGALGPIDIDQIGKPLAAPVVHRETVRMVLTNLLPAINAIHGGCAVCRNHFKDTANAVLEADGVPYRFSEKVDGLGKPVRGPDGEMLGLILTPI